MEFPNPSDFDRELEALLSESEANEATDAEIAALRERVADAFNVVLEEKGYTPLNEDSERYARVAAQVEQEIRAILTERFGVFPESEVFDVQIRKMTEVRMMELANVEDYIIEVARGYGEMIEIARITGTDEDVARASQQAEDGKLEVYANLMIRRQHVHADNPAVQAMISFLPGGEITEDDERMIHYYRQSIEGLPDIQERNSHQREVVEHAYSVIGFDPEEHDGSQGITPEEKDIAILIQAGLLLARYDSAEREARLYETAAEKCTSLTPQNVHDIIQLINVEIPVDSEQNGTE